MNARPKELMVDNPKTIKLLSNTKAILILQVFSLKPKAIKDAAKDLDISISNCQYWVKKFLKFGILTVAYQKKRAGSATKYYWLSAEQIIIDLEPELLENYYKTLLTIYSELTLKGLLNPMYEFKYKYSIRVAPNEHGYLSYLLMKDQDGKRVAFTKELLNPEFPASVARWGSLELKFEDAKAMQNELYELVEKYKTKTTSGQKIYFFQTSLVPEVD